MRPSFFLHVQFYNVGKPRTWAPRTHHVDHAFQNSMRVFVLPPGLISVIVLPHKTRTVSSKRKWWQQPDTKQPWVDDVPRMPLNILRVGVFGAATPHRTTLALLLDGLLRTL